MKVDFAPVLLRVAKDNQLSPQQIVDAINDVAPGSVSRRAVGYWLASAADAGSRRCDSSWVSLLVLSLERHHLISRKQSSQYLELMREMAEAVDLRPRKRVQSPAQAGRAPRAQPPASARALDMVIQSAARSEHRAKHRGKHSNGHLPFDPRQAVIAQPGF